MVGVTDLLVYFSSVFSANNSVLSSIFFNALQFFSYRKGNKRKIYLDEEKEKCLRETWNEDENKGE